MDRFDTARALVLAAGARLRLARPEAGAVWEKTGHQDLVTRCDRETEQFLRSGILSAFPGDAIVGEEYPATPPGGTGCVWYLDPIDGTTNFVSQLSAGCAAWGVWHWSCAPWPRVKQRCLWRCVRVHGTTTRRASFWLRPEAVSVRWTEPLCRRTRAAQCLRPVPARFWNRCSPAFPQIRQAGRTVDAPFARPRPRHCTDVFWTVHSP